MDAESFSPYIEHNKQTSLGFKTVHSGKGTEAISKPIASSKHIKHLNTTLIFLI